MTSARAVELEFPLWPKQALALLSKATELLFGGAAGGGKSHLVRIACIVWCTAIPGLQVYFFRRILPDLMWNHMDGPRGFRVLLAIWVNCGLCQIVEDEIRFWNGSKIHLCHCKDEKDRFKYIGAEIHVLIIEELTQFTETIYRFLRFRVRAVNLTIPEEYKGQFPRILCSSNPGQIGHQWVKRTFVKAAKAFEVWRAPIREGGMLRQYIPAKLEDNPSIMRDDPAYEHRMEGLGNKALVRAMRHGDWDIVAGAYFDEFRTDLHVVPDFTPPAHWTRFRSLDWGSAKPFSVGWYAIASEDHTLRRTIELPVPAQPALREVFSEQIVIPKGAMVRYREWYGCAEQDGQFIENMGLKLDSAQVAKGILDHDGFVDADSKKREQFAYNVADPSIFNSIDGPSIGENFSRHGVVFKPGDNRRVGKLGAGVGWDQVRLRLNGEDGRPMLYVTESNEHFIRTVPEMQHDENKIEDLDTDGEDHIADELRFACMSRPWRTPTPEAKRAARGAVTIQEMVERFERNLEDKGRRI